MSDICKSMKPLKIVLISCFALVFFCVATVMGINAYVKNVGANDMISSIDDIDLSDVDCILVLGCHVRDDATPSDMLADRLDTGVLLYEKKLAPKLLMSGDHSRVEYNEVGAMKAYAMESGVPSGDIFMDHAGFSTYESIYRAKEVFGAEKILIVTQEYHLYRALYVAEKLGLEAYGVSADARDYSGQEVRDIREILARFKDFFSCVFQPTPTYLGDRILLEGNGNVTND